MLCLYCVGYLKHIRVSIFYSEEEEHNWVFSADQVVTDGAGSIISFGHLV